MNDFNTELQKHTRWIKFMANSYGQDNLDVIKDLEQEGRIGLFEALKRFDPTLGYKFLSYAKWWIKKYQIEYLNQHGRTIRLPNNKIKSMNDDKFHPTTNTISLETPSDEFGHTVNDTLASSDIEVPFDGQSVLKAFNEVNLKDREKDIILMYFGMSPYEDRFTYKIIGEKYDISKERVRQLIDIIMDKIRNDRRFIHSTQDLL